MTFGKEMFVLGRSPTELREIAAEALLHLVVENYAEISTSLPLDLGQVNDVGRLGVAYSRQRTSL